MRSMNAALAVVAVSAAAALAFIGQPTLQDHLEARGAELSTKLASREIHLDPAELNVLLHDPQSRLQLLDVRSEGEFNLFHIKDAHRITLESLREGPPKPRFDPKALKIFIAQGEREADEAWRLATAAGNRDCYVLAGGIDLWLAVYRDGHINAQPGPAATGQLASFTAALGDRYPYALPDAHAAHERAFKEKAKRLTKAAKPAGGCGG
ncbi:MAG: rhodanese-like domain-containing protein [Myxococcales bacterium]|nr:rhodanese-like domain-containing protein [Myxococcales bacterium]